MAVIPSLRMRSQELCALPLFAGVHIHSANPSTVGEPRLSAVHHLGARSDT
jgi:hypothetical protein